MSDTTTITPEERHYYVREKQFQITSEDVRSWLMEATRDRRKTTYELNFRIHRLGTALKSVQGRAVELEAENVKLQKMVDWLAMHLSGYDDQKKCTVYAADWREAASRAVAGEGEVRK